MKLSWRVELFQLLIIGAMFGLAGWSWSQLPDRLPVHWNLHGEVDRWGGKPEALLTVPSISAGLYLLLMFIPMIDPGRVNYASFAKAFNALRISFLLFMALLYSVMVLAAFGYQVDMNTIVLSAAGVLFFVIGNFMGKIRPNWFVGVRTPWTLSSKLSWDKTHRLAGWLFMVMGAGFILWAVVPTMWMFIAVMTIDGLSLAWMVIYSYLVYRRDPDRTTPAATSPGAE